MCPPIIAALTFMFAAEYTGREKWLRRRRIAALLSVAAVTFVLLLTGDAHHLVRGEMIRSAGGLYVGSTRGPWRVFYGLYNFALVFAAIGLLVVTLRRQERVYRSQIATIAVAILVPTAANIPLALRLITLDPTPIGFTITGILFAVALYRYRLLDIRPIARSTVFDTIDSAVFVVDRHGTVVDASRSAQTLLGIEHPSLVGRQLMSLFEGVLADDFVQRLDTDRQRDERVDEFVDRLDENRQVDTQVELITEEDSQWYDVSISPIYDDTDQYLGRVVMVRDVTDRERQRRALETKTRELERQNEHLEQVASFVSHDLRNPLNIATGHLELARENGERRHFGIVEDSLDRMDRLVDRMLEMARQGQSVTDTELVAVADVATEAWSMVDTGEAKLEIDVDRRLSADRDRLLRLFENLFRNAVEHGLEDEASDDPGSAREFVVRVGAFDDGFYVEDTGPGIPAGKREDVFEQGFTTGGEGAGLGLSIVEAVSRAHGWSVSICESPEGGARFEISTDRDPAVEVT